MVSSTQKYAPFMFDERHEAALLSVTWDMDTGRMTSSPDLMRRFPRTFRRLHEHIPLAIFVAFELEGAAMDLSKETVTTFTPIRQDLRVANLLIAPLTPRGYKPATTSVPPDGYAISAGRFMPRGVTMINNLGKWEFHVRMAPLGCGRVTPRKISIRAPKYSLETFEKAVVPQLVAGWSTMFSTARRVSVGESGVLSEWQTGHELYSELLQMFEAAHELVA